MNNARLYNAAISGFLSGMSTNRVHSSASLMAACVAFATDVDNAIAVIPAGASVSQAALLEGLCRSALSNVYTLAIAPSLVSQIAAAYTLGAASLQADPSVAQTWHTALNVCTAAVADLNAFTVAGNDGIDNVAGDVVILAGATGYHGPYVVGTVTGGIAPLTRPSWFSGPLTSGMQPTVVQQGSLYGATLWNSMPPAATFNASDVSILFFPYQFSRKIVLNAGTLTVLGPVFSPQSGIQVTRSIPSFAGVVYSAVYDAHLTGGYVNWGYEAQITVQGCLADGTVNVDDTSSIYLTVTNGPFSVIP